jgi:hypothetical protein
MIVVICQSFLCCCVTFSFHYLPNGKFSSFLASFVGLREKAAAAEARGEGSLFKAVKCLFSPMNLAERQIENYEITNFHSPEMRSKRQRRGREGERNILHMINFYVPFPAPRVGEKQTRT